MQTWERMRWKISLNTCSSCVDKDLTFVFNVLVFSFVSTNELMEVKQQNLNHHMIWLSHIQIKKLVNTTTRLGGWQKPTTATIGHLCYWHGHFFKSYLDRKCIYNRRFIYILNATKQLYVLCLNVCVLFVYISFQVV